MNTPKKTTRQAAPRKTSAPKPAQQVSAPRQPGIGCSWKVILIVVGVLGFLTLGALNSKGNDRKAQDSQRTAQLAAQASGSELGQAGQQPTATAKPTRTPRPTSTPKPTKTPMPTNPPAATAAPTATAAPAQRLVVVATSTSAPAAPAEPTAAPTGGTDANPIFTQDGDWRHVDPAWWPCKQGQIKGNNNSMIYHTPHGSFYDRTWDNVTCFNTAQEAAAAGFRASKR